MIGTDGRPTPVSRCAACRTHSSALLTHSRPCVRSVSRSRRFPLVRPLPSSASAASSPALFVAFSGTMDLSDFPCPSIIGVRPQTSRCGPPVHPWRADRGSPSFCARCFRACSGSSTPQGPSPSRDSDGPGVAFRRSPKRRHPRRGLFRSSIPSLHVPLSTLHPRRYRRRRMTRRTRWFATPSSCETFTRYTSPALLALSGTSPRPTDRRNRRNGDVYEK